MLVHILGILIIFFTMLAGITYVVMNLAKHHIKIVKLSALLIAIFGGLASLLFIIAVIITMF